MNPLLSFSKFLFSYFLFSVTISLLKFSSEFFVSSLSYWAFCSVWSLSSLVSEMISYLISLLLSLLYDYWSYLKVGLWILSLAFQPLLMSLISIARKLWVCDLVMEGRITLFTVLHCVLCICGDGHVFQFLTFV